MDPILIIFIRREETMRFRLTDQCGDLVMSVRIEEGLRSRPREGFCARQDGETWCSPGSVPGYSFREMP